MRRHGTTTRFPSAPDLCIEVISPSNTKADMQEKMSAYLAAGAREVWLVAEAGAIEIWTRDGLEPARAFDIALELPA